MQWRGKKEYMCLCCFLPPRWNTTRLNQSNHKTTIACPLELSPIVRYREENLSRNSCKWKGHKLGNLISNVYNIVVVLYHLLQTRGAAESLWVVIQHWHECWLKNKHQAKAWCCCMSINWPYTHLLIWWWFVMWQQPITLKSVICPPV